MKFGIQSVNYFIFYCFLIEIDEYEEKKTKDENPKKLKDEDLGDIEESKVPFKKRLNIFHLKLISSFSKSFIQIISIFLDLVSEFGNYMHSLQNLNKLEQIAFLIREKIFI